MSFASRLMKLQYERRETNYKLARAIGVHQTTIKNWQSGTIPQLEHLGLLADHYGVTVDELLKEK